MIRRYVSLLAAGVCAAALIAPGASAQTTPSAEQTQPAGQTPEPTENPDAVDDQPGVSDENGEIVVTGIRQALERSIQVKRDSAQIIDTISAEDIGKLPDQNIAESLQRVPGVQVRRGIGDASSINIRGLTQINVLINGRPITDSQGRGGSGPDTIGSGSYGVFAVLPPELVSRLDVIKAPSASDIEGGIGGTVNIVTRRPLDPGRAIIAASVQGYYNELRGDTDYKVSGLFTQKFADDTFGILLNAVYSDRDIRQDAFTSFAGYQTLNANPANPAAVDPNGDGIRGYYIADMRFQRLNDKRKRFSANGAVQWQPTPETDFYVEGLYSKQNSERDRPWLGLPLVGTITAYTNPVLSPNEALLAGTVSGRIQNNREFAEYETEVLTAAAGGSFKNEIAQVFAEGTYSRATADQSQTFVRLRSRTDVPFSFDFRGADVPRFSFPTGFNPDDINNLEFSNVFDNFQPTRSEEYSARIDGKFNIGDDFRNSVEAGLRWSKLEIASDFFRSERAVTPFLPANSLPNASESFAFDDFFEGQSGASPFSFRIPIVFANDVELACLNFTPTCERVQSPIESFSTSEDFLSAYAKLNWERDLDGVTLGGNVGVRYNTTDQTSLGNIATPAGPIPNSVSQGYDDWLPSAIVRATIGEDVVVRLGAAKVISRPASFALRSALTINATQGTATGGNPNLDPFRADQADLSLEWYFAQGSLLSAGLFYKDVQSFTVGSVLDDAVIPGFADTFDIATTINGGGGEIRGIELAAQVPFAFLPNPLDGFGVSANYSYIESETTLVDGRTGLDLPLPGLSKHNVNLIGFYEKGPLGVRLAYAWRDEYLIGLGVGGSGTFFDSYEDLSATVKFEITENFGVDLEAANLLNSARRLYAVTPEATADYSVFGRSYSVTLRARF